MSCRRRSRRAERVLKKLVPGAFLAHDPVPLRDIVFGIFAHEISGRAARP
jgi:hypothetical protein